MRLHNLRRALREIVLVGLPAAMGCAGDGGGSGDDTGPLVDARPITCFSSETEVYRIETPADAEMQFLIDQCAADVETCNAVCTLAMARAGRGNPLESCVVDIGADETTATATYEVYNPDANDCPVDGRRPAGLAPPAFRGGSGGSAGAAGAWLAYAAWLEAASVHAFAMLARELAGHGAPARLVRAAVAAARDEIRHTELMTRLALRYGARPPAPVVAPLAARPLVELAVENAAEGCVRETWGAVVALWQSRTALDPVVRATFAEIARDEARHAALAWTIDRWLAPQLDADGRARVAAARELAARALLVEHAGTGIPAIGLPGSGDLAGLAARANRALWAEHAGGGCAGLRRPRRRRAPA
jgi:hypothetical protein